GAVETLLASPGPCRVVHSAPCMARRKRRRSTFGEGPGSGRLQARAEEFLARLHTVNSDLPGLGGVAAHPYHATASLLFAMLHRDDLAFADAVNPDEARAYGGGVDGARMLHERLAVKVQSPHFYVQTDGYPRFDVLDHKKSRRD